MVKLAELILLKINKDDMKNYHTHIVLIEQPGAPEVLKYQLATLTPPGPGEVLIRQKAIGVNFLDTFFRNGSFPSPAYPAPIGLEAAGLIEAVGEGITGFAAGDRVAYYAAMGAYAEHRILKATELLKLPDDISFEQAAAMMIKGLTAHMLVKQSHEVKAGETILIHAMTGGVGTILSNWVRALGANVIGTVGSAQKKELALKRGFTHVIDLQSEDFVQMVRELTRGKGVDAVYDGTGKATFEKSLALVKPGGSAVLYGWPSGMPTIDEEQLEKQDIRLVRAVLNHYPGYQDKTGKALPEIFDLLRDGIIPATGSSVYVLKDAAQAHADLESRKTTGSIILRP